MEGEAVNQSLLPFFDQYCLLPALLSLVVPNFAETVHEDRQLEMVVLKNLTLDKALEQGHACEVAEEAPRLLILLDPLCVPAQEDLVIEELTRVGVESSHPSVSPRPLPL